MNITLGSVRNGQLKKGQATWIYDRTPKWCSHSVQHRYVCIYIYTHNIYIYNIHNIYIYIYIYNIHIILNVLCHPSYWYSFESRSCPGSLFWEWSWHPEDVLQGGFVISGIQPSLVGGLEHHFYDFPYIGNFIIPTDFHIFQRGRVQTTNQLLFCWSIFHFCWSWVISLPNHESQFFLLNMINMIPFFFGPHTRLDQEAAEFLHVTLCIPGTGPRNLGIMCWDQHHSRHHCQINVDARCFTS